MDIRTAERLLNLYKRAFRAALELGFYGRRKNASWWDDIQEGGRGKFAVDWREMQKQMTPEQLKQMMEPQGQQSPQKPKRRPTRDAGGLRELQLSQSDIAGAEALELDDLSIDIDTSAFDEPDTSKYRGMSALELNDELQNAEMLLDSAKRKGDRESVEKLEKTLKAIKTELDNALRKGGMKVCGASWAALEHLALLRIAEREDPFCGACA